MNNLEKEEKEVVLYSSLTCLALFKQLIITK